MDVLVATGSLLFALVVNLMAFVAGRYAFARACGVRELRAVFSTDPRPWGGSRVKKLLLTLSGPMGCYVGAALLFSCGFLTAGREEPRGLHVMVVPESPAARAGFQLEDRVVSVDDVPIASWDELRAAVGKKPGQSIRVAVDRHGGSVVLTPTPGANGRVGITPIMDRHDVGIGSALFEGFGAPAKVWAATVRGLMRRKDVEIAGPIGYLVKEVRASDKRGAFGTTLKVLGLTNTQYIWVAVVIALLLFPRERKARSKP